MGIRAYTRRTEDGVTSEPVEIAPESRNHYAGHKFWEEREANMLKELKKLRDDLFSDMHAPCVRGNRGESHGTPNSRRNLAIPSR